MIFFILFCLAVINFILIPIAVEKLKRVYTLGTLCDTRHLRLRGQSVRRLFRHERNDCNITATRCTNDKDCDSLCFGGTNQFHCDKKSRLCLPTRSTTSHRSSDDSTAKTTNKCFPHKGVMGLSKYDPQTNESSWKCVSLFPALFDDAGQRVAGVCEGADSKFNVNLQSHYPRIEDCKCSPDRTLVTFSGRKFGYIRHANDIPRCVKFPHLYQ